MADEKNNGHYWPRTDKPWKGPLEDMSHQHQEDLNRQHERDMADKGDGPLMEKYRAKHEFDFMQTHDCGLGDCPDHDEKPLDWDFPKPLEEALADEDTGESSKDTGSDEADGEEEKDGE